MKTVIIVQCRMRSSRLPGKALLPFAAGMSQIEFLLRRLQLCKRADQLILTTGVDTANDPIVDVARKVGVVVMRGPEDDVLARFVAAAAESGADVIVRVCADNPLTDPFLIDDLVAEFQRRDDCDHLATFAEPDVPYGVGAAIFSRAALELADGACGEGDPSREHVEPFMLASNDIKTVHYTAMEARRLPTLSVTVDRQRDYDFVQPLGAALLRRFGIEFCTEDLVQLVSQPRIGVFANGDLGLAGVQYFKEINADIAALVLHPPGQAFLADEIKKTLGLRAANVTDFSKLEDNAGAWLEDRGVDIIMSLWSSYLFKDDVLTTAPLGVYNLHNSLLPSLGGSGANIWALILGVETGATLHRVTRAIDKGPIIDQRLLSVDYTDNGKTLFDRQHSLMIEILRERWRDLALGAYDYIAPTTAPSYFKAKERDQRKTIDLDADYRARDLINLIRAYQFGDRDAAYFYDEDGKAWDLRLQITRRGGSKP